MFAMTVTDLEYVYTVVVIVDSVAAAIVATIVLVVYVGAAVIALVAVVVCGV